MGRGQQSKVRTRDRPTKTVYTVCGEQFRGTKLALRLRLKHHREHCSECAAGAELYIENGLQKNMSVGRTN
jgi:hypothetical protein